MCEWALLTQQGFLITGILLMGLGFVLGLLVYVFRGHGAENGR